MKITHAIYIEAPSCPQWCECHRAGESWDVHPGAVTKTCTRTIECSGGAAVELERFASIEDDKLLVEWATVRVRCDDPLGSLDALTLAETIVRAVEMVEAPGAA